eukprot:GHVP01052673.1.p1 GENE.GHVP01052673.1~~GHVP01052673.1.p1  ORF type:complete len:294 (+),score=74.72 GHVP01052673.1:580-1461(+)
MSLSKDHARQPSSRYPSPSPQVLIKRESKKAVRNKRQSGKSNLEKDSSSAPSLLISPSPKENALVADKSEPPGMLLMSGDGHELKDLSTIFFFEPGSPESLSLYEESVKSSNTAVSNLKYSKPQNLSYSKPKKTWKITTSIGVSSWTLVCEEQQDIIKPQKSENLEMESSSLDETISTAESDEDLDSYLRKSLVPKMTESSRREAFYRRRKKRKPKNLRELLWPTLLELPNKDSVEIGLQTVEKKEENEDDTYSEIDEAKEILETEIPENEVVQTNSCCSCFGIGRRKSASVS